MIKSTYMQDLKDKNLEEIKEICHELGLPAFKAKEIFVFIHNRLEQNLEELTTLKLEEREKIKKLFYVSDLCLHKAEKGRGVEKSAFRLQDGKIIEAVFMDYGREKKTLCVSSQVGCAMSCGFCATGKMGFKRNLSTAEILSQVYYFAKKNKISNLVFMGMGEPFLNYDQVMKAAHILNDKLGLNIASRKITVSTIGILSGIKRFAQEEKQFRLAWSLAAPFDHLRRKLTACQKLPSIQSTISALKEYQDKTKRRITIEYVVLRDINDRDNEVLELARIAQKLNSHINLVPYNPSPGIRFKCGNVRRAEAILKKLKVNTTIRKSLGQEISAACGQLSSGRY